MGLLPAIELLPGALYQLRRYTWRCTCLRATWKGRRGCCRRADGCLLLLRLLLVQQGGPLPQLAELLDGLAHLLLLKRRMRFDLALDGVELRGVVLKVLLFLDLALDFE